jgi:hypothetical protein
MAFTRFHDDPCRIKKELEESSFPGRYLLNTPGQGIDLPFLEDPQVRMQKWGGNLRDNTINLESDLRGLTRPLNRDLFHENNYKNFAVQSKAVNSRTQAPFVEESRASHPAWMYKDLEQPRWEHPLLNPLDRIEPQFPSQVQTRILEKDAFRPTLPVLGGNPEMEYYLSGKSACIGGREKGCWGAMYSNIRL